LGTWVSWEGSGINVFKKKLKPSIGKKQKQKGEIIVLKAIYLQT
jgi:hypothetical protein